MADPARQVVAKDGETVSVHSERFGAYEVPVACILRFPDGLIGFPEARRFVLMEAHCPDSPFRSLLCLDLPELGFVVCDPEALWPGYAATLAAPGEGPSAKVAVLAIVTIPENPQEITANLMAPLLIDCRSSVGRQVVLDTGRYSTRHPLLTLPEPASPDPATAGSER